MKNDNKNHWLCGFEIQLCEYELKKSQKLQTYLKTCMNNQVTGLIQTQVSLYLIITN